MPHSLAVLENPSRCKVAPLATPSPRHVTAIFAPSSPGIRLIRQIRNGERWIARIPLKRWEKARYWLLLSEMINSKTDRQRSFNWQSTAFVMRGLWVRLPSLAFMLRSPGFLPAKSGLFAANSWARVLSELSYCQFRMRIFLPGQTFLATWPGILWPRKWSARLGADCPDFRFSTLDSALFELKA